MLLSIIIPVYNTKDYLAKCVGSILSCDISDCEIILVDDGSTDGYSGELCDILEAKNAGVVRVIHQANKGLGGARNTGIDAAKGEYLLFIDSDDTVAEGAVDIIKSAIEKSKSDVISFNIRTDDGKGNGEVVSANYVKRDVPFTLKECPEFLLSLPSACNRVWRKKLFVDNGIQFPDRVWYEDIRTTTKIFAVAESISTIDDALYIYYQREGSIMRSDNLGRNREIIDAFEDLLGWYKEKNLFEAYKEILCRLCVDNVYITSSVRVLRVDKKHALLKEFIAYLKKEFPEYKNNKYLSELPGARKLVYKLLEVKMYGLIALLFKIRGN